MKMCFVLRKGINIIMGDKIIISKKSPIKGEDGYKIFSVRIKDATVEKLDEIAKETNRYRNDLINVFLEFALQNYEIEE